MPATGQHYQGSRTLQWQGQAFAFEDGEAFGMAANLQPLRCRRRRLGWRLLVRWAWHCWTSSKGHPRRRPTSRHRGCRLRNLLGHDYFRNQSACDRAPIHRYTDQRTDTPIRKRTHRYTDTQIQSPTRICYSGTSAYQRNGVAAYRRNGVSA